MAKIEKTSQFSATGDKSVHISLDVDNAPILAIVGTEVRRRQMSFAVTDEFINRFGLDKSEYTGKRWTSKTEAHVWLDGFASNLPSLQSAAETSLNAETTRMGNVEGGEAKSIEDTLPTGVIEWFGSFTTDKGFRYYNAFRRNGITIPAQSFIHVFTTKYSHLVAYIESLYETRQFKKRMRVIWLHKKEEIDSEDFSPKPHPREVFMSGNRQVIDLESFNGSATVLSWDHFERCTSVLPGQVVEAYVCRRLYHADGDAEGYDIGTLEGYWKQNILSMAGISQVNETSVKNILSMAGISQVNETSVKKKGPRKPRKRSGRSSFVAGQLSHYKADAGTGSSPMSENDFGPNTEVEVFSEDSGIRGCWFRCHVLEKDSNNLKLKYLDVMDVDTNENLEEWHSLHPVTASDGFHDPGRWSVRPPPPKMDVSRADVSGTAVDVQFEDRWCEGVLISHLSKGEVEVYLPEKKEIKMFHTSRLRISKDWVDGEWIDRCLTNLPGKVSSLHCEKIFTSQVLKISKEKPKLAFSDLESDITAAHQSSDSGVPVTETEVTEIREEVLSNYSKWSGKVSDSGCASHTDLRHSCVPTSSSRNFIGINGSVQHYLELKQPYADRFEKILPSKAENKITGVMSKLSRKRRHEIESSISAMSAKSVLYSLRGPISNLVLNGLQGSEDRSRLLVLNGLQGNEHRSLGWPTENGKRDISEVELNRSRYGHEHVKPLSRSSGSLFNTVSTANLVMSR